MSSDAPILDKPHRVYLHDFNDPEITPWTDLPIPDEGEEVVVLDFELEFGCIARMVRRLNVSNPHFGADLIFAERIGDFFYL